MTILRILCVHGDESVVETLGRALQTAGYEVILVTDGVTALRILARERVDAIVLDYEMEAPDGPSLRNQIHHLHPNVPMLLFSDVDEIGKCRYKFFGSTWNTRKFWRWR
jgi:DNA-binding NtrC family response regulator